MNDTQELLCELIRRPSLTPDDAGCQEIVIARLQQLSFSVERLNFADTRNIWLRRGNEPPLFTFLGHTDVVPPGPLEDWKSPPFTPTVRDDKLYGRGAADMKGSIACFITALERFLSQHPNHKGSIAVMLTSDEEGIATDGVVKVVEVLQQRQEQIDWCLVGEPSSNQKTGDVIRVGRRGSLSAKLIVHGIQGHVAYPDKARNPIHSVAPALSELAAEVWDQGNAFFPPTTLQISNIHAGTGAENIIPGHAEILFNLRFSTELTAETIKHRVVALLDRHDLDYELQWRLSGQPFLTSQGELVDAATKAIHRITGIDSVADTGGGTSDGRFIAPTGAQVIELGPVNESIHKINENIALAEIDTLSAIYENILLELLLD